MLRFTHSGAGDLILRIGSAALIRRQVVYFLNAVSLFLIQEIL